MSGSSPFTGPGMGAGYAASRPPLHDAIVQRALAALGEGVSFGRALDVGCGAGLSTRALTACAAERIGLEPFPEMLRWSGSTAPGARFVAGRAEHLPFASGSFQLITAAGSLNYVDLACFFPEARHVLAPDGLVLVYDFEAGRMFAGDPSLERWFEAFSSRYPRARDEATALDPDILRNLETGFVVTAHEAMSLPVRLTPEFYLEYILTETNVAQAVQHGVAMDEIRAWCAETLAPVWRGRPREVLFRCYFAWMRPRD